jgi:hypothetical protein
MIRKNFLNLALVAAVAAEWNGQSADSTCGMQLSGASMVNATCTVSGTSIKAIYAGNGAFISGANTLTGFDGVSGDADVVVFFDQDCSTGECDNSTCWDAALSCVDNGSAASGVMFMETVNAAQAGIINLQIANVNGGETVTITLNDDAGNSVALTNITSAGGVASAEEAALGSFSVTAGENFGDLLQVSVNAAGVVNLFQSEVVSA